MWTKQIREYRGQIPRILSRFPSWTEYPADAHQINFGKLKGNKMYKTPCKKYAFLCQLSQYVRKAKWHKIGLTPKYNGLIVHYAQNGRY